MSVKVEYFPEMSEYYHAIVDANSKTSTKNSSKAVSTGTAGKKQGRTPSAAWINSSM
jgi:hypothetical protein